MNGADGGGEPITEEGIAALREEIEQLEGPGRTAMAARIKVAREEGDLKENAEYHIAKEDQAHLETKIKRLRERLRTAVVVEVDGDADASPSAAPPRSSTRRKAPSTPGPWSARPKPTSPPAASRPSRRSAGPCSTPSPASRSRSRPRAAAAPSSCRSCSAELSAVSELPAICRNLDRRHRKDHGMSSCIPSRTLDSHSCPPCCPRAEAGHSFYNSKLEDFDTPSI